MWQCPDWEQSVCITRSGAGVTAQTCQPQTQINCVSSAQGLHDSTHWYKLLSSLSTFLRRGSYTTYFMTRYAQGTLKYAWYCHNTTSLVCPPPSLMTSHSVTRVVSVRVRCSPPQCVRCPLLRHRSDPGQPIRGRHQPSQPIRGEQWQRGMYGWCMDGEIPILWSAICLKLPAITSGMWGDKKLYNLSYTFSQDTLFTDITIDFLESPISQFFQLRLKVIQQYLLLILRVFLDLYKKYERFKY